MKSQKIVAQFPKRVRHAGRLWLRKDTGIKGYSSEDGEFDILVGNGYCVLVAFEHESPDGEEFWRKRFVTAKAAMEYAEKM